MIRSIFIAVFFTFSATLASADNWPRFRGPEGKGKPTSETSVPLEWSESKNLKWKLELPGPGSSSPIVWGRPCLSDLLHRLRRWFRRRNRRPEASPHCRRPGVGQAASGRRRSPPPTPNPKILFVVSSTNTVTRVKHR